MKLSEIIGKAPERRGQTATYDVAYSYHKSANKSGQSFVIKFSQSGIAKIEMEEGDRADIYIEGDIVTIYLAKTGEFTISRSKHSARIQLSAVHAVKKLKEIFPEKESRVPFKVIGFSRKTVALRIPS